ncbi:MAG: hypothetical protein ACD_73C00074G0001 [uncultured bacterium]|nr:MAG: hypothetical protein ACD_73C00074G0001 [uncultured bacterium]
MNRKKNLILFLFMFFCTACSSFKPIRWMVYYGDQLNQENLKGVDLAVVEPDFITPKKFSGFDGLWIAYLSLGEVNESRSYWSALKMDGALLEANPDWPGAYQVNLQNETWRKMVLDEIVPALVEKGFHGLFFDTIDVASYLEAKDPKKYSGMVESLINLIQDIHKKYPQLLLFPNNGLDFLNKMAPSVDGVFVEDVYTHFDTTQGKVIATSPGISREKEGVLDLFAKRYSKNVFVIHYGNSVGDELSQKALEKARKKGYQSYLTTINLDQPGKIPY